MGYYEVNNFRPGLDTRRGELTSLPGTLESLVNAHINQGGEIEKRKAFTVAGFTGNCYDLVPGVSGGSPVLYTFSSNTNTATFPSTVTMQDGNSYSVICQQLTHPDGSTAMTGVVSATAYLGLPFVIASFADGNNYVYYNGNLVVDFTSGLVLAKDQTTGAVDNTKLAADFAALFAAPPTGQTGNYTAVQRSSPIAYIVDVTSNPNTTFNPAVVVDTTGSGVLSYSLKSNGTSAIPGVASTGSFVINAINTGGAITNISIGGTNQLLVTVNYDTSVAQTAADLVVAINGNPSSLVVASNTNLGLLSSSPQLITLTSRALSAAINGDALSVTTTGAVAIGNLVITVVTANTTSGNFGNNAIIIGGSNAITGTPAYTSAQTAATIATNLAAAFSFSGYAATVIGSQIFISKTTTTDTDVAVTVTVTSPTGVTLTAANFFPTTLVVTVSNTVPGFIVTGGASSQYGIKTGSVSITASITPGTAPYTYSMAPVSTGSNGLVNLVNSSGAYVTSITGTIPVPAHGQPPLTLTFTFGATLAKKQYTNQLPSTGTYLLTITDSSSPTPLQYISDIAVTCSGYS